MKVTFPHHHHAGYAGFHDWLPVGNDDELIIHNEVNRFYNWEAIKGEPLTGNNSWNPAYTYGLVHK